MFAPIVVFEIFKIPTWPACHLNTSDSQSSIKNIKWTGQLNNQNVVLLTRKNRQYFSKTSIIFKNIKKYRYNDDYKNPNIAHHYLLVIKIESRISLCVQKYFRCGSVIWKTGSNFIHVLKSLFTKNSCNYAIIWASYIQCTGITWTVPIHIVCSSRYSLVSNTLINNFTLKRSLFRGLRVRSIKSNFWRWQSTFSNIRDGLY